MRPLNVSILSDLHFDSHFPSPGVTEAMVCKLFDPIFTPEGMNSADVLIIAGDLGHDNDQIDPKYSTNHGALKEHRAYTREDGKMVDIHCNSIGQLIGRNTFGLRVIEL